MHVKYWINLFLDLQYRSGKYLFFAACMCLSNIEDALASETSLSATGCILTRMGSRRTWLSFRVAKASPLTQVH